MKNIEYRIIDVYIYQDILISTAKHFERNGYACKRM